MKIINTTFMYLKRVIFAPKFAICCIALAFLNYIGIYNEISRIIAGNASVLYFFEYSVYSNTWMFFLVLSAIPSTTLYCEDIENHYFLPINLRCSKIVYSVSLCICSFISAFLVVFIAEILFIGALNINYPLFSQSAVESFSLNMKVYSAFMTENLIVFYYVTCIFVKALCAACCASFALMITSLIQNSFVAISSPLIFFFILENLTAYMGAPTALQINSLAKNHVNIGDSVILSLIYPLILFGGIAIMNCYLFKSRVIRKESF